MNYSEYSFVFDTDDMICPIRRKEEECENPVPYASVVEKIRSYHGAGAKVVLFISRNMNSYDGNPGLINKSTARILTEWLNKWNIPYDEIFHGKSWPGHKGSYMDDHSIRSDEFLTYTPEEPTERHEVSRAKEDQTRRI